MGDNMEATINCLSVVVQKQQYGEVKLWKRRHLSSLIVKSFFVIALNGRNMDAICMLNEDNDEKHFNLYGDRIYHTSY